MTKKINKVHDGYPGYVINEAEGGKTPVYYTQVGDNLYLSPACISRNVYRRTLYDFLGQHKPCTGRDKLCDACGLFGMVGSDSAIGSRLRFSDASAVSYLMSDGPKIIKELAGPKISCVEFYCKDIRPGGMIERIQTWNYDFKTVETNNGQGTAVNTLLIDNELKIRGRKFYLHNNKIGVGDAVDWSKVSTNDMTQRNMSAELMTSGELTFDVYFDGITNIELQKLIWSLNLGGDGKRGHKIGAGKPLGLGSVEITIAKVELRSFNGNDYSINEYSIQQIQQMQQYELPAKAYFNELQRITLFDLVVDGNLISYPIGYGRGNNANCRASHQWFIGNKQVAPGSSGTRPIIDKTLPEITADNIDLTLAALEEI